MKWTIRAGNVAGAATIALAVGLLVFLASIPAPPSSLPPRADGIVVLTGGEDRIRAAALALQAGRGRRLLISGVNRMNGREEMRRVTGLAAGLFDCCVDLGYTARNTMGNAAETRDWAAKHNINSLIVVTTTLHMPRSLAEIGRAMPDARLIPHAVAPHGWRAGEALLDRQSARIVLTEYIKFLPSAALHTASRLWWRADSGRAGRPPDSRSAG